jgi:adenosylmethionine---8-amino-7-oxononanoate aminotransferase
MKDLSQRDRRVLWHPYTQEKIAPAPIAVVKGEGVWLYTADGRKILDGISSWWVNIHGHGHPFLSEALAKQARELEQVIFAGFTHQPAVELAEKLIEILPVGLSRVFYSDNGSTAVEVALKMAYQFWQNRGEERKTFVALANAYHGDTFGAMAASDDSAFTAPFKNLLCRIVRAASPDAENFIENLEQILQKHAGDVAALIVEPLLQGAGGMIVWRAKDLLKIRRLCDEYGVLLIADEVLTGFGRTGKMFACEHAQITPDVICLSKGLTAGYLPLGATIAKEAIYEAFLSEDRRKTFFHGHSYTANPLACAVGRASLELFERENSLEKVALINRKFNERLPQLIDLQVVKDVRIIGAVGIVELRSGGGYLDNIGQRLAQEFLSRNILLRPLGNVLYFMPPYVISESEIDWVLNNIEEVLQRIEQ